MYRGKTKTSVSMLVPWFFFFPLVARLSEWEGGNRSVPCTCHYGKDKKGELVTTYRKSFLYETDKVWAQRGKGFHCCEIDGIKVCQMDSESNMVGDGRGYSVEDFVGRVD